MTHEQLVKAVYDEQLSMFDCINGKCCNNCAECAEKLVTGYENDLLQDFAQWLWDNGFLTDEAFTIKLVEQYREKTKEGAEN